MKKNVTFAWQAMVMILACLFVFMAIMMPTKENNSQPMRNEDYSGSKYSSLLTKTVRILAVNDYISRAEKKIEIATRIDGYLSRRGSPLQGYGMVFADCGEKTGVNPYLSVAISGKESYFGHQCFSPYNAWGMLAYSGGFPSWEEGIKANFAWLQEYYGAPQSAYDCKGYCVPDHPWMEDVQAIIWEIAP